MRFIIERFEALLQYPQLGPSLDAVLVSENARKLFQQLVDRIDLRQELQRALLGGFDSWEDYERYSDAFITPTETVDNQTGG